MCGRFVLTADPVALQTAFNLSAPPANMTARYNIAPTQPIAVITSDQPRLLSFYKWGLIPSWSKDMTAAAKMINARSETAHEKPSFRTALRRRRCIIPADGFYEWTERDGGKQPMFIHRQDHSLFGFAGLWETWNSPDGGEVRSATILTTDANQDLTPYHHRMPVILHPGDYDFWLSPKDEPLPALQALMKPFDEGIFTAYPVSRLVNKSTVESPELIQPIH